MRNRRKIRRKDGKSTWREKINNFFSQFYKPKPKPKNDPILIDISTQIDKIKTKAELEKLNQYMSVELNDYVANLDQNKMSPNNKKLLNKITIELASLEFGLKSKTLV